MSESDGLKLEHLNRLHQRGLNLGAVILAGGLSRRMGGVDKGLLTIAGKPMIAHVLQAVRPAVDTMIINANRNTEQYAAFGTAVHADIQGGHLGPLAGMSTGLAVVDTSHLFMCPCDSPFIESTLVARLALACVEGDHDIAVAADDSRLQPVFAVVNRRVESSLHQYLDSGERKIDRWYASLDMVSVACTDLSACFLNINTEEERLAAEETLGSGQ